MRFRPALQSLALAGLISAHTALPANAQSVDPAVVGERLQRLNVTVESLEATAASQKRQIDALASEILRLREEHSRELSSLASRGAQRPWAEDIKRHNDDLKRLADAIQEVDRKRAADHEQSLKILGELRKAVTALAEAPPPKAAPRRERPDRTEKPDRTDPPAEPETPVKAVPYTVGRGETLSLIVEGFNTDAKKKGYQPLTVQQVMKFNKVTDPRKIPVGAVLNLPLYPAAKP